MSEISKSGNKCIEHHGTRTGNLDPGVAWHSKKSEALSPKQFNHLVNHESGLLIKKRKIIGLVYSKNLCFGGSGHRTPYASAPLALIMRINRQLQGIKKGEKLSLDNLSPLVALRGVTLNTSRLF